MTSWLIISQTFILHTAHLSSQVKCTTGHCIRKHTILGPVKLNLQGGKIPEENLFLDPSPVIVTDLRHCVSYILIPSPSMMCLSVCCGLRRVSPSVNSRVSRSEQATRMPGRNYTCFEVFYKHFNWIHREDVWLTSIVCWSVCSSGCSFEFGCLTPPHIWQRNLKFTLWQCIALNHLYWFCVV